MIEQSLLVVQAQQQRPDELASRSVAESADDAIGGADGFDLLHPAALAGQPAIAKATPTPDTQAGSAVVDTTLAAKSRSRVQPFLRVKSHLVPSADKLSAPTLKAWNLQADCTPTQ